MTTTASNNSAAVRQLFGVPISALTMSEALDEIDRAIAERRPLHIGVVNAAKIVNMQRDPALRAAVLESDLILADGISVVWASRALRQALPERVAGIDLMTGMFERGNRHGYRVFVLGATSEVLASALNYVRSHYPNIDVVGHHHGYFSAIDEPRIAEAIAAARPDILLVGMTSPKKEQFLARWSDQMRVPISHGVGGSLDVIGGKVRRAPKLWQRLGLEWLYRVAQEPRRLWRRYLVTNVRFCWLVLTHLVRQAFGSRSVDAAINQKPA